jgi:NADPH:quinone reductase-like Zn-dependent oxidoreductase
MAMTSLPDRLANLPPEARAKLIRQLVGQRQTRPAADSAADSSSEALRPGEPFRCSAGFPGNFESIKFRPMDLTPPAPGQVQVQVRSYGLNFRDLMIAMGMYPATPGTPSNMGSDCAGVVTACGDGVDEFAPGDEVFGVSVGHCTSDSIMENCHFASTLNVQVQQVVAKPPNLTFEDAAGIPTVFATAYYGLHQVARMQSGESVLIHTATGGVGLAAIQVARWLGAKIYATAGNNEKRRLLTSMGIDHPMDSRSTEFATRLMELTDGRGVDVILNTLSGEAVPKGIGILRPFGRFIQIDKKDIAADAPLQLGRFDNGLSFTAIDIGLFVRDLGKLQALLNELAEHFRAGHFSPIQTTRFPIRQISDALNYLSRAQHIGKIVLSCD